MTATATATRYAVRFTWPNGRTAVTVQPSREQAESAVRLYRAAATSGPLPEVVEWVDGEWVVAS